MNKTLLSLAVTVACCAGQSAAIGGDEAVYFDTGQYSATLLQKSAEWRLRPLTGGDIDVIARDSACRTEGAPIPKGVWLVTRDDAGRLQLLAPSTTELPAGFPQTLPLDACGDTPVRARALEVPRMVFDWISGHVGSVMIDD